MGGCLCMVSTVMLVMGALALYGSNKDEAGSMLMVAASICLLAAVVSWKSVKPEIPEPRKLSQEPEENPDKDLFDGED